MATARRVRERDGLIVAVAALAWVLSAQRMRGMDMGPPTRATDLGTLGWFAVTWLLMMAAMMLPSLVPAARTARAPAGFVAGYLGVWLAAGLVAYALWEGPGRWVAAGVILAAAGYQVTAVKGGCLNRCRTLPPGGGLRGGVRYGAACVGCCAGLMAALFALGVMSLAWMAVVAALIAVERLAPWRTPAVHAVAATLAVLAISVAVG